MKRNVYLCQVNHSYGGQFFLPYSVGLLQAYAQKDEAIRDEYAFKGFVYSRRDVVETVGAMERPDVFAASCYIWNAEYTFALARTVKEVYPNCLIVLGGPHVPVRSEGFFKQHPWADLLIHYEGEQTFKEVLLERLTSPSIVSGPIPYSGAKGLSVRLPFSNEAYKTQPRERISDLDSIPSPYLTGVFNELMKLDCHWHPTQETHRGCPYSCTFCDWGSNTLAKLKQFGTDRLEAEFEWFAKHGIDLLYNADANYGIYARDVELTERLVRVKEKYGYPNKFRAAYAKNSNDRVFQISKLLNDAGLSKGTTLSFQSMDDTTLDIIKRKNIRVQDFKNLMGRYRAAGIPTYSEIIVGLPGETYDSFADGINTLLEAGQHDSLQVYTCEVLPNAEMAEPAYREAHGLRTVRSPVLFYHGTPAADPHQEFYELVVATKTLPPEDWLKCQLFAAFVQAFHCLGLTQCVAVFLRHYAGVGYREFYEKLIVHAALTSVGDPDNPLGQAYWKARSSFDRLRAGEDWGWVDRRFGDLIWPVEEGMFLHCAAEVELFYDELFKFVRSTFLTEGDGCLAGNLVNYQQLVLKAPMPARRRDYYSYHNIHDYLACCYKGLTPTLHRREANAHYYRIPLPLPWPNLEAYAREVVWYGRKGGKFLLLDKVEEVRDG